GEPPRREISGAVAAAIAVNGTSNDTVHHSGTLIGGVFLSSGNGTLTREEGLTRAKELAPLLRELSTQGLSARAIARELTARKITTHKGGSWHAATVLRMLKRLSLRSVA